MGFPVSTHSSQKALPGAGSFPADKKEVLHFLCMALFMGMFYLFLYSLGNYLLGRG